MPERCRDCGSPELVKRRNRCRGCHNKYQRIRYAANPNSVSVRRQLYAKHADKRKAESAARKLANRDRYSLLEWFRKKGIPAASLPPAFEDLVLMKKALRESKI